MKLRRVFEKQDGSLKISVVSKKMIKKDSNELKTMNEIFSDGINIHVYDFPKNEIDSDCWILTNEKKVKVCPIKKAEKEAKKAEKENKKNLLKSKLKLSDEEIEILKTLL